MHLADGIEEKSLANNDATCVWMLEPGQAVKQGGLAGSGSSEEDGDARRNFDGDVEGKRSGAGGQAIFSDLRGEHREDYFATHGVQTRRFTA